MLPLAVSLCVGSSADEKYVFPPPDDSSWLKGFGFNFSLKNLSSRKVYGRKTSARRSYIRGNSGNGNFWATLSDFPCEKSVSDVSLFFFLNYYKTDKRTRTKAWTGKHHIGLEDENQRIVRCEKVFRHLIKVGRRYLSETCRFLFMNPKGLTMQKLLTLVLHSSASTISIMCNLIALAS